MYIVITTERLASKTEVLEGIRDELDRNLGGDVSGSAVVSLDGNVFAARFSGNVNVDRLRAITATTLDVGRRVARNLSIGICEESIIRCENGYFLVVPCSVTQSPVYFQLALSSSGWLCKSYFLVE